MIIKIAFIIDASSIALIPMKSLLEKLRSLSIYIKIIPKNAIRTRSDRFFDIFSFSIIISINKTKMGKVNHIITAFAIEAREKPVK